MTYSWKKILSKAKDCTTNVKKEYKLGISSKWAYYFAKAILNQKKDIKKVNFNKASKPTGIKVSRQIPKEDYIDMAKRLTKYVELNKSLPNYILYKDKKIKPRLYTLMFAKVLVSFNKKGYYPAEVTINSKAFTKPIETDNEVYNYFVKVFGSFDNTIDGALKKVANKGYGYYYDDVYSNKQSIDRMKAGKGVNCTDSCHVFYNILLQLIALKKYKKVDLLHVKCQGGDGHVRLRITMNDGSFIYRDPAAVLDNGIITSNWCLNGSLIAINPQWFLNNLNR